MLKKLSCNLLSLSVLALFSTNTFAVNHSKVVSTLGMQNGNAYYMILSQNPPAAQNAACTASCYPTLNPNNNNDGGQQWVDITSQSGWIDLEYDICSAVAYNADGDAQCSGYLGHVGVSLSPSKTTISNQDGGNATLSAYQAGKPFVMTFTPTQQPATDLPNPASYSQVPYRGINLAGAEFDSGFKLPYASDASYYVQHGMNFVRLPFKWEYVQPDLTKPIDFTQGDAKQLADLVNELTSNGITVMLDMHNYLRYDNSVIGETGSAVSAQNFANAWASFASEFKNNPLVIFDLMNEPNSVATETILDDYNVAIPAIRSAGFHNKIMLEGNAWTGLSNWSQNWYGTSNAEVFLPKNINDPDKNYVINVHEYFNDPNGGGSGYGECVDPNQLMNIEKFQTFADWIHQNKVPAFLSEIGTENTSNCIQDINIFLNGLEQNPYSADTGGFLGWSAWTGGHAWDGSGNALVLNPVNGQEVPQMSQGFDTHLTPVE